MEEVNTKVGIYLYQVVDLAEPVGVVEGRVGEDVVDAEVGVFLADVGLDAADGEIHDGEAAGGGVALLAVDGDVAELAAVGFDEFFRLHEHAAGAAGGVADAALVGGEHVDEAAHNAGRGVELINAPALALLVACGSLSRSAQLPANLFDYAETVLRFSQELRSGFTFGKSFIAPGIGESVVGTADGVGALGG